MIFQKVKELRQTGRLEEALQLARDALAEQPDNIWNKRAAAWVYYDYLKNNLNTNTYEIFKEYLIKIKELDLPDEEKMIFDRCASLIGKMVFLLQETEPIEIEKIDELFEIIKDFHFTKPSKTYTYIYKAFHKVYPKWNNYLTFADWWGFENFCPEDYLKQELNGKKIMSVAEQAYIGYSKKLLEGEIDLLLQQKFVDKEKIQSFLPRLDAMIERHPEYLFLPYFKARLLLAINTKENLYSVFLPFARKKRNDFWVWNVIAEITDDEDEKFACLCKALTLNTPDEFLVKIRESLVELLLKRQMYNEAKTEINNIISTRQNNEWKIPPSVAKWTRSEWYEAASENANNNEVYLNYSRKADIILYKDIPEELVVVTSVNKQRKILNFMKDIFRYGFFVYEGHIDNPQIGDLLMVRLDGHGKNSFYKIYSARKAEDGSKLEALREFEGKLTIHTEKQFGLVKNVFIEPKMIKEHNLTNDQIIKGMAVRAYNEKKKEWGWKAIKIR